jgi:hypothetical protein
MSFFNWFSQKSPEYSLSNDGKRLIDQTGSEQTIMDSIECAMHPTACYKQQYKYSDGFHMTLRPVRVWKKTSSHPDFKPTITELIIPIDTMLYVHNNDFHNAEYRTEKVFVADQTIQNTGKKCNETEPQLYSTNFKYVTGQVARPTYPFSLLPGGVSGIYSFPSRLLAENY